MKKIGQFLPRSFWMSIKVSVFFSGLLLVWMVLKPGSHDLSVAGNMLALPVSLIIGVLISFSGRPRWWHMPGISLKTAIGTSQFWQPALFLILCICSLIAQTIVVYLTFASSMGVPRVSWADFFFLSTYPLTVAFFFLLPTRPLASLERSRVVLNTLILMITASTLTWFFLVGPILFQDQVDLVPKLVTCAYPLGDLTLFFCLLQLTTRTVDARMRPAILLLILATLIMMFLDSTQSYQTLNGTYTLGTILDICMPLVYLSFGLAVHALRMGQVDLSNELQTHQQAETPSKEAQVVSFAWISFLPYTLIPAVIGLMFYVLLQGRTDLIAWGVYTGCLILILLTLTRQVTLIRAVAVYAKITALLNEELHSANGRLETLATADPLTGLPNHRALLAALTTELERAQRYQRPCTLLFLDLDHFKALNDSYGHTTGDEVLIAFGQRLSRCVRGIDTVGRWGGEEFIAILAETTMDEAQKIAERVRTTVSLQPFAISGGLYLTCSIGLASYPAHATELSALIQAADHAMYAAKRLGRNQCRQIDDPTVLSILANNNSEGSREEVALSGFIAALIAMMAQRDTSLGENALTTANLAERLAIQLGVSSAETHIIRLAGQLHDIGKIGIPDALLHESAPLTPDETQLLERHPALGAEVVTYIPSLRPLAPVIRAHHERWDGTGYPDQLRGENIPFAARVIAVAGAYAFMSTNVLRPSEDVLQELRHAAGTQFDPTVIQALSIVLADQPQKSLSHAL